MLVSADARHDPENQAMSISIDRSDAVTTITIERPAVRNALDPDTAKALHQAFVEFEHEAQARVAVLTGSGDAFCAGFDLRSLAGATDEIADWLEQLHFDQADGQWPLGPMGPTRMNLSKPVIAAINGAAVAGGMELAMWCDLRIMESSAYMGVFCRRWGVPLIDGGTVRLPRLVGQGRAMELILTGRRVNPDECLRIGLCEQVVEDGDSLATALALAEQLASFPPACLRADRQATIAQQGLESELALRREFDNAVDIIRREGIRGARRFASGKGRHGEFDDI